MDSETEHKCGFVALLGAPNAGKSTLLNALVGSKVAIVTHKIQTTRIPLRGITNVGDSQIVFIDTPGLFTPKSRLDRAMTAAAWASGQDADVLVHVVDSVAEVSVNAERASAADKKMVADRKNIEKQLKKNQQKALLVLNKVDKLQKPDLLPVIKQLGNSDLYTDTYMLSAQTGSGLDRFKSVLADAMPKGPWHFPADQVADVQMCILAAEITREKLMLRVHQELPYVTAIETENFENKDDGSVRIEQTIFVERDSQRAIILGDKGKTIKAIGTAAREDIGQLLDTTVHLFLNVKVKSNWQDDRGFYNRFGLDFQA